MADLPIELGGVLGGRLARCLDMEEKIPRALEALGPIRGRDVLLIGRAEGTRAQQLIALGARLVVAADVTPGGPGDPVLARHAESSVDVVVGLWSAFRPASPAEITEVERVTRPGGRLLIVHDYGRDDVSRLRGDLPEYDSWSRRTGPFLANGFRVRVLHCFWTWESLDDASDFLASAFGDVGAAVAKEMTRPRLSYKVAVYHRTVGDPNAAEPPQRSRVRVPA